MPATAVPIITFTSDFGLSDHYVAQMKAAALACCPGARLIDITHMIPRHDILHGSIVLERAISAFPRGSVHVGVVDPGVGTTRKLLIVETCGQFVVCPDNGLISWVWRLHGGTARQIIWRPKRTSAVFHGRDILAPIAGMVAQGVLPRSSVRPLKRPILLSVKPATATAKSGQVIYIDVFGNAMTNIPLKRTARPGTVSIHGQLLGKIRRTYSDVGPGAPLALIGSSGFLEIAVREGSACDALGIQVGDEVQLCR